MRFRTCNPRQAAAAAELAILLPVLVFVIVIAIDWARVFWYSQMLTNCARHGALYASDPIAAAESPYLGVQQAALAAEPDASNWSPQPSVSCGPGTPDSNGNATIAVTVSWALPLITTYPGVGNTVKLSR